MIRYVAVRVNNNQNNKLNGGSYITVRGAIDAINWVIELEEDWWRVIEIPVGEDLDYDGTVVAEIKTGRLW